MLLYAITDRHQLHGLDKLVAVDEFVFRAAQARVDYIQLRERDLGCRELERLALRCIERIRQARDERGTKTKLLINSRADLAIACGADGVHLRSRASGEISAADARAIFDRAGMSHPVIAVSCHTESELLLAESEGADFAVFGPVFSKGELPGAGLEALRRVCSRKPAQMPVLALGGVTLENARQCIYAGAAGIAAIRLFQQNLEAVTRSLRIAEQRQA
jgi:thiamine-phosphate pyrophosphorylase